MLPRLRSPHLFPFFSFRKVQPGKGKRMCMSVSRSIEVDDWFMPERHLQFSPRGGSAGVELRTRKLKSPRFT